MIPLPPIDIEGEKARLSKIAKGLAKREASQCRFPELNQELFSFLSVEQAEQLRGNIASINPQRVIENFPWDAAGHLALKASVVLKVFCTDTPPGKDRQVCLAAVGPERRGGEQVVSVQLADLIVPNQTNRWDDSPWLWTGADVPAYEWLGSDLHEAGPSQDLALESLRLLDQGQIESALSLCGVTLSSDLHCLLVGEEIAPPACCARLDESWRQLLINTLRSSAPWRLPKAVSDEAARLDVWAKQKSNRRRRPPDRKLVIFPGQFHARKASLMLTGDIDGSHPRFMIEATATNARIHDTAWKRPLRVDFLRYGILFPHAAN